MTILLTSSFARAVARYQAALSALSASTDAGGLLAVLLARDNVQQALDQQGGSDADHAAFLDLLEADVALRAEIARPACNADLARWRPSRAPSPAAWWWQPPPATSAWPARLELALTVLLLLIGLTLAVDSTSRFVRSGLDLETATALIASSLLAIAAARVQKWGLPGAAAATAPAVPTEAHPAAFAPAPRLTWAASQLRLHVQLITAAAVCTALTAIWFWGLPNLSDYYSRLGEQQRQQNDNLGALTSLARAVQLNPNNAAAHFNLGVLYDTQGDTQAAIAEYQYAIQNDTQSRTVALDAQNNLARTYILAGRSQEAVLLLEALRRLTPDCAALDYVVCKNLGWAWYESGNLERAAVNLQRASEVAPDAAIPHCLLAEIDELHGRYAAAQVNWRRCQALLDAGKEDHPDDLRWRLAAEQHLDPDYLIERGHEQMRQGELAKAALIFVAAAGQALETDDLYQAQTNLGAAQLGQAQRGEADYATAAATLRTAVMFDARAAAAHCLLAETLAAADAPAGEVAAVWQQCCVRANDQLPDERVWLGKAQLALAAAGQSCAAAPTAQQGSTEPGP